MVFMKMMEDEGECTFLVEEKENSAKFGSAYADYQKASKRYIPFVL